MPFITTRTNVAMSDEQATRLKTMLGRAIALVPGKSEQSLLLAFEPQCRMYLRGDGSMPAYIEVSVWGNEAHRGYDRLTAAITHAFNEVLAIPPENIYIRYADIPCWGAAGMTFDRNQYM